MRDVALFSCHCWYLATHLVEKVNILLQCACCCICFDWLVPLLDYFRHASIMSRARDVMSCIKPWRKHWATMSATKWWHTSQSRKKITYCTSSCMWIDSWECWMRRTKRKLPSLHCPIKISQVLSGLEKQLLGFRDKDMLWNMTLIIYNAIWNLLACIERRILFNTQLYHRMFTEIEGFFAQVLSSPDHESHSRQTTLRRIQTSH